VLGTSSVRALFRQREMVRNLVRRDLVERYQRSWLGIALALFMPLLVTAVFSLMFSGLMPGRSGTDYALRVFVGYLAWDYCSRALSIASETLRGHGALIGKVRFPLEVLPLTTCLSVLTQLLLGLLLFVVANGMFGTGFHATMLWLPVLVGLELAFVFGVALVVAALSVALQDFAHLLAILLTVWFYGCAVFFSTEVVPSAIVRSAFEWNPMYQLILALRTTCIDGRAPDVFGLAYLALCALAALFVGRWVFDRYRFALTEILG